MSDGSIQHAFVLGAGLGTRLRSLTAQRPKPLIPICQKSLISFAFDHLIDCGVREFVVNTHHRAEMYAHFFPGAEYRGLPIRFRHETDLLETGGGIKNVADLLGGKPFVVYNGDIFTDLPLRVALEHHRANGNEATLVLRSKDGPLQVALEENSGRIVDIARRCHAPMEPRFLFTGIYILQPEFFARLPTATKFSVIDTFVEMIRGNARIEGVVIDEGQWWDLGNREKYLDLHRHLQRTPSPGLRWLDPSAEIDPSATISGATVIGEHCHVGSGARLHDCILWEHANIASGAALTNCIVASREPVHGIHDDSDF